MSNETKSLADFGCRISFSLSGSLAQKAQFSRLPRTSYGDVSSWQQAEHSDLPWEMSPNICSWVRGGSGRNDSVWMATSSTGETKCWCGRIREPVRRIFRRQNIRRRISGATNPPIPPLFVHGKGTSPKPRGENVVLQEGIPVLRRYIGEVQGHDKNRSPLKDKIRSVSNSPKRGSQGLESSNSRTFRARLDGVNGFCRRMTPSFRTPWWTMALSA